MKLLATTQWSFGRDKDLLRLFEDLLLGWDLDIHYLASDVDHNRTVAAFSGRPDVVFERVERLSDAAFERIDLNRHVGVHPRIGALDVCSFVGFGQDAYPLGEEIEAFCSRLAERHELPIFLYERSEKGRHAPDLASLRSGGFGGLLMATGLASDFGPPKPHPRLGASIVGECGFRIGVNVEFHGDDLSFAKQVARGIREARREGRPLFSGVLSMGLPLASRQRVQVSLLLTKPDYTSPDAVIEYILDEARRCGVPHAGNELIGAIRIRELDGATRLAIRPEQVLGF